MRNPIQQHVQQHVMHSCQRLGITLLLSSLIACGGGGPSSGNSRSLIAPNAGTTFTESTNTRRDKSDLQATTGPYLVYIDRSERQNKLHSLSIQRWLYRQ